MSSSISAESAISPRLDCNQAVKCQWLVTTRVSCTQPRLTSPTDMPTPPSEHSGCPGQVPLPAHVRSRRK
ncbi:hypothetical protein BDY19DRAFT_584987 [Irpex rosettiformis]|uniref:Uncharacterized protein n=1 Tax=Irpex rosettiformis TaxID=378272 RepID=A0ACB8UD70_9APHY|nr:hypothetical protein BDY19DRAFT_584987 [Irpex rosettiformis]